MPTEHAIQLTMHSIALTNVLIVLIVNLVSLSTACPVQQHLPLLRGGYQDMRINMMFRTTYVEFKHHLLGPLNLIWMSHQQHRLLHPILPIPMQNGTLGMQSGMHHMPHSTSLVPHRILLRHKLMLKKGRLRHPYSRDGLLDLSSNEIYKAVSPVENVLNFVLIWLLYSYKTYCCLLSWITRLRQPLQHRCSLPHHENNIVILLWLKNIHFANAA